MAVKDEGAVAEAAPRLDHMDGCPAERIEDFTQVRPLDKQFVKTTRCIDCGAQRVDQTGKYQSIEERPRG